MKIAIIVEGATEKAFLPKLRDFIHCRLPAGPLPQIRADVHKGRIPTGDKLRRVVESLLRRHDHVIALTDVYTGQRDFEDAADAKRKMRQWVGSNPRFHPHAAQYDFEAWLLPYWDTIQKLAKHTMGSPSGNPESVNHMRPPAHRLSEIFEAGKSRKYIKPREAAAILRENDLTVAVHRCPELKSLINTILQLCGGKVIS